VFQQLGLRQRSRCSLDHCVQQPERFRRQVYGPAVAEQLPRVAVELEIAEATATPDRGL
jgi:hypothetical protein